MLLLFALVAQGVHQINNPAKAPRECGSIEDHFHRDGQFHNCDLCDHKIESNVLYQPGLFKFFAISGVIAVKLVKVDLSKPQIFLQRGPPQV